MKTSFTFIFTFLTLFFMTDKSNSQPLSRADVEIDDTWRLEDIYASDEAWREAKKEMADRAEDINSFKGEITNSAKNLREFLEFGSEISKEVSRLYSYASMNSDVDTRVSDYLAMKQEMGQLLTRLQSLSAFSEPEILAAGQERIEALINSDEGLEKYRMYLTDLFRKQKHRLSASEEKIMAEASMMMQSPYSIYNIFTNAELPYPTVELSNGEKATLNQSGYSKYRAVENRTDREKVFNAFFSSLKDFERTIAEQLYSNVKVHVFNMRTRNYDNTLQAALDNYNIPTEVYHSLIENVNTNLSYFHRYLELKKRMLGVDTLKYIDLYAPVVKGVDLEYNINEGKELVLDAMKPLGNDYVDVLKTSFDERWIDVYPTAGKQSGAYSNGSVYDVHPYVLLNYNNQYEDVSTLAHEMGHALHSYYSNMNQPYALADYSIFVAEVASTFNEVLLMDKMLNEIKDDDTRLSLLMNYLDGFKGTLFRQTQFAEFELAIHEKVEKGEPLTSDVLDEMYGNILNKYYGHDKGVTHIDELYKTEWAFIPHFYYNYYVYQYATSYTASIALGEKVLNNEAGAVDNFIAFLSSGNSDYPINLLKKAGVDMTTREPFTKAMDAMDRVMDEIEEILERKGM
ncbi:MAG TPA: oligoendopeptidase F [Prolixibacteraceae bacterium]|nr:oligoendopeptidase F [Prolixibacteraceae bacterium]